MMPAAVHTANTAGMVETWRLTSDGWTKIDAPMMIPTTIAVACTRPIERRSKPTVYRRYARLVSGFPFSAISNARNFAGFVVLALRDTPCN